MTERIGATELDRLEAGHVDGGGYCLGHANDAETAVEPPCTTALLVARVRELESVLQPIVTGCRDGDEPWLVELPRSKIDFGRITLAAGGNWEL